MKVRLCTFTIFVLTSFAVYGQQGLAVGDKVPEFKAPADNGST